MYEKFHALLIRDGLTPYRVAADTGIAQSTLSDWKRGVSNPKIDKLVTLAKYFNVPLEYFLDDGEKDKNERTEDTLHERSL